jgi:hypothetical protein
MNIPQNHVETPPGPRRRRIGMALASPEITGHATSQNVTINELRLAMLGIDGPGQTADDGVIAAKPACVALVSTSAPVRRPGPLVRLSRPDPSFVTHLIATVEQVPQTRLHRRAAQADALSAYRAHQAHAPETGFRTRQVI